jgi:hypothetical protein
LNDHNIGCLIKTRRVLKVLRVRDIEGLWQPSLSNGEAKEST